MCWAKERKREWEMKGENVGWEWLGQFKVNCLDDRKTFISVCALLLWCQGARPENGGFLASFQQEDSIMFAWWHTEYITAGWWKTETVGRSALKPAVLTWKIILKIWIRTTEPVTESHFPAKHTGLSFSCRYVLYIQALFIHKQSTNKFIHEQTARHGMDYNGFLLFF